MAIVRIQQWQFFSRDQTDDVTRSILLNEQEKNELSCIWTMCSIISRLSTKKARKYVEELSLKFLNLKTEFKNSYWFVFYCLVCLDRWSKF